MFYLSSWRLLSDDRAFNGMGGIGAIPYPAISAFARDHGICGAELTVFHRLIKAIDAEYLNWAIEKQKQEHGRSTKVTPYRR